MAEKVRRCILTMRWRDGRCDGGMGDAMRARTQHNIHSHTLTRTHERAHTHARTNAHTNAHARTKARTNARARTHSHTNTRTHACTHTQAHTQNENEKPQDDPFKLWRREHYLNCLDVQWLVKRDEFTLLSQTITFLLGLAQSLQYRVRLGWVTIYKGERHNAGLTYSPVLLAVCTRPAHARGQPRTDEKGD